MKLFPACFAVAPAKSVLVLAAILLTAAFTCTAQNVTVYSDDFKGSQATFGVGKYDYMTLVRAGVSVVRSVKVPAGLQVTIFEKDKFEGTSLLLLQDANMKLMAGKGFGNVGQNVSLIIAKAPAETLSQPVITIYKDNFSGAELSLRAGHYDHFELGAVDNDKVSSVKIPKGMKVTLYEHGGYTGRSLVLTQDATADYLIRNKFNDVTSSIYVEVAPEPVKETPVVVVTPVVVPVETKPATPLPAEEAPDRAVIIYQGDFSGLSKRLAPGRYDVTALGIGNDELSSVDLPDDLRVTLYEKENFTGRSLRITSRTSTEQLTVKGFNNLTSSLVVEVVPKVSVYQGNFDDFAFRLKPGKYDILELERLGLPDNELSSVSVPSGMSVILFDDMGFKGRALYLTHDAGTDSLIAKKFNNITSSIQVNEEEETELPTLKVTVYQDNFTGKSKLLTAGNYDHADLGIGNNTLSAISIPRGLRVTLYEHGAFEGRSIIVTKSIGPDLLKQYRFDDATSSIKVEEIPAHELVVTIYSDRYSGRGQKLSPGRYYTRDITIGDKQLSSVKVPKGMRATLYADWNCKGMMLMTDRDEDFTGSKAYDNYFRSVEVEDVSEPVIVEVPVVTTTTITPVVTETPAPVEETKEVPQQETAVYTHEPSCELSKEDFESALKSIKSKPFSEEKMQMARLVTKDKCLTHDQIRTIAKDFGFEEQSLEFVKYAYDLCKQKDTYYKLEDVFKFMSTQGEFRKFLEGK